MATVSTILPGLLSNKEFFILYHDLRKEVETLRATSIPKLPRKTSFRRFSENLPTYPSKRRAWQHQVTLSSRMEIVNESKLHCRYPCWATPDAI